MTVHDNEPQFVSQAFYRLYNKLKIRNVASTVYNSTANGQAKAFNKIVIKILKKLPKKYK